MLTPLELPPLSVPMNAVLFGICDVSAKVPEEAGPVIATLPPDVKVVPDVPPMTIGDAQVIASPCAINVPPAGGNVTLIAAAVVFKK